MSGELPVWRDKRRVAVIVLNFRAPDLTVACVESLRKSDGISPNIVVIDNASGDDSADRLRTALDALSDVTFLARTVNDGYTGGNNAGFEIARSMGARYAFILNNDTLVDPGCLRRLVDEADADANVALVAPRIFFGDPPDLLWFGGAHFSLWRGRAIHVGFRQPAEHGWTERRALPFASGCALLVRLSAVPAHRAIFDASLFTYAEDLDLSLRVLGAGHTIRYVPEAVVWHLEGIGHRRAGGQALRFYLSTRNLLTIVARHARWYHWITLAPMLAVDVIGRWCAVAVRDRDPAMFAAVLRGAAHSVTGGRHPIELAAQRNAGGAS